MGLFNRKKTPPPPAAPQAATSNTVAGSEAGAVVQSGTTGAINTGPQDQRHTETHQSGGIGHISGTIHGTVIGTATGPLHTGTGDQIVSG